MKGIIEGFYGTPWTWERRREVCRVLAGAGMDTYVYAPKDDPLHRERWREPYPGTELDGFASLAGDSTLRVGFAISPGLSMDLATNADRDALLAKVRQMTAAGISLIGLLLDDLDPAPGLGRAHGELTAWLRDALDPGVELFMVPLHYTGSGPSEYLDQLAEAVPVEVPIGWTGSAVVNRTIEAADAQAWRAAMGGRRPLLWDNTPVNDAVMVHHLFTGPLRGREPALAEELSGYLANPTIQARAGLPALVSAAAWLRGEDPDHAWRNALGPHRVFMEGCDGVVPGELADRALGGDDTAADELASWLAAAERVEAGDLGDEVQPWIDQLRTEAAVARQALELLRCDLDVARRGAALLYLTWPPVRAASAQVLGGRGALLPAMAQDEQSRWVATAPSWVAPASVTDRLVAAAFARLG